MADIHEATCREAIRKAIASYQAIAGNPAGRGPVKRLKNIRDARMAHNLPFRRKGQQPTYNGLFVLADVARVVADQARLAVLGGSPSLDDYEGIQHGNATSFWKAAFADDI